MICRSRRRNWQGVFGLSLIVAAPSPEVPLAPPGAVASFHCGKIDVQPLQVEYRGLSMAALQGQRDNGKTRPAFLIDWVETRSVDEDGMRAWGPHRLSLANLNSAKDFQPA
jgi:hypothetical protein